MRDLPGDHGREPFLLASDLQTTTGVVRMKVNPSITLSEFVSALRNGVDDLLSEGDTIGTIYVESYGKVCIVVSEDGMVECAPFRHDSTTAPL